MKKTLWVVIAVGTVVVAIVASRVAQTDTEKPRLATNEPMPTRLPRRENAALVKATGVVRPAAGAEIQIGSQSAGLVRDLWVNVGDTVQKNQRLFALDAREVLAQRDQAEAALLSAQTTLHFEVIELDRQRQLAAASAVSQSALESNERRVALAQAAQAAAQATLALARVEVDRTQVKAPIAGVVVAVFIHQGEMVTNGPAPTPVLTLMDLAALEVRAYVDETDIGRVTVGQQASFTVDAFADQPIAGVVTGIYPKPEIRDNVVSYVTVVRIMESDRPRPMLRPEMTASVRIAPSASLSPVGAVAIPASVVVSPSAASSPVGSLSTPATRDQGAVTANSKESH